MENHSQTKFLRQFVKMIKQDIKRVGIITDKDGTILLDDSLRETLKDFKEKHLGVKIYFIANSGRTIQDMVNCLEEQNIPISYFDYIIGDNGGMCLDIHKNKLLYKNVMNSKIVSSVIKEFLDMGGTLENIRLADGRSIYAYPSKSVKEYYATSKDIKYKENITDLGEIDVSKLTLTGSHDLINKLNKLVRENINGYRTHIGKTTFPNKEQNNYRMDFTGMNTKGDAAKDLKEKLALETCIYMGNDLNDISMFSKAIDDNDFIVIANNEHRDITTSLIKYLKEECKIKGIDWNDVKILVLEEQNVNNFLGSIRKILAIMNSRKRSNETFKKAYKIKPVTKSKDKIKQNKKDENYK